MKTRSKRRASMEGSKNVFKGQKEEDRKTTLKKGAKMNTATIAKC